MTSQIPSSPRRALITGIAGQDGSYLAEYLLSLGYEVFGIIRRNSVPEHQESRIDGISDQITTMYGDLTDSSSLERAIRFSEPHEIYNLAAQSHVRISFDLPQFTSQVNALGVLNLLESVRASGLSPRIYQASSSEMFGTSVDSDGYQRESTPMTPVSPYGCSKLFAYSLMRNYRQSYGLFLTNGILFNHESPRRGSNFVTTKIVKTAVQIKLGQAKHLTLGNLDSRRDWGHSKDYVRAMHAMLGLENPDDLVIATGSTTSVRELVEKVFGKLDLDWNEFVSQDERYMRPQELPYLRGDASKAKSVLGWEPVESLDSLVEEMIAVWLEKLGGGGLD